MSANRALVNSLECYMDELFDSFQDYMKKCLILLSVGVGIVLVMLGYMLKMLISRPEIAEASMQSWSHRRRSSTSSEQSHSLEHNNSKDPQTSRNERHSLRQSQSTTSVPSCLSCCQINKIITKPRKTISSPMPSCPICCQIKKMDVETQSRSNIVTASSKAISPPVVYFPNCSKIYKQNDERLPESNIVTTSSEIISNPVTSCQRSCQINKPYDEWKPGSNIVKTSSKTISAPTKSCPSCFQGNKPNDETESRSNTVTISSKSICSPGSSCSSCCSNHVHNLRPKIHVCPSSKSCPRKSSPGPKKKKHLTKSRKSLVKLNPPASCCSICCNHDKDKL